MSDLRKEVIKNLQKYNLQNTIDMFQRKKEY